MAQISAVLVLAIALASEANQYETTTNPTAPTTKPVCDFFACPTGYDRINLASTANNLHTCCRERVSTTTKKDAKDEPKNIVSTTLGTTKTVTPKAWYEKKNLKNGLTEGAAAAGLATLAGLGISAIVQANKETTPPPSTTAAWTIPPTLQSTVAITTPQSQIKSRAEGEGSSVSPLLLGLLLVLAACCCLCLIGFCVFMTTRKRSTKVKRAPLAHRRKEAEYYQEAFPLIHEQAPPPALAASSFVPATTVMPAEYVMPITVAQSPSLYAPAATYATGSVYAPAVYAPATTQYAGIQTPGFV